MTFPTKQGTWAPSQAQIARWRTLYRRVELEVEFDKAIAWLEANPTRQKTLRGMPKFCVSWLNRASVQSMPAMPKHSYRPRATRDATCPHAPVCPFPGNWQCQQRTVLEAARVRYR
jgi:hypothetical protein